MKEYVDESVYKHHPVAPTALLIILCYDNVEIVNPLGSKTSANHNVM